MLFRKVIRLFVDGNVIVTGLRGRGKDMLISNVVMRRKGSYISNVDYGGQYFPLDYEAFDIDNTTEDLVVGDIHKYVYPYADGLDIYISDAGVYFPAQDFQYLNKKFDFFAKFMALSRHLGSCNIHCNTQNVNRLWDKIREQSDTYIICRWCKVLFKKLVIQRIWIYDNYESCEKRVPPFPMKRPLFPFGRAASDYRTLKAQYEIDHGEIRSGLLIYRNRSSYDTRFFKTIFERGERREKKR